MIVMQRSSIMSETYSADVGSLSAVSHSDIMRLASGLASFTVHGAGLGQVALTAMGCGGQIGCTVTGWESETSVRCMMGHGARGCQRIVITADERGGTGSIGVSMDAVVISTTRRSNSAGSGSASVTVHGAGLGFAAFAAMIRGHQVGVRDVEW